MQLNTESPPNTLQANPRPFDAALPRPPLEPAQLDVISVMLMWLILVLCWLLYLSLRVSTMPKVQRQSPPDSLSVPITPCDVSARRSRS
jgi:hypothetical protein